MSNETSINLLWISIGLLTIEQIGLLWMIGRIAKSSFQSSIRELQTFAKEQLQEMRIAAIERRLPESWDAEESRR